jgi:hypothetical protein
MPFQISPGVNVSEIDLTTSVPAVATSIGAMAGRFQWGPCNEIVNIGSETELVEKFGKPNNSNYKSFFTAANFLSYSNLLKVVRVVASDAANAVTGVGTTSRTTIATENPTAASAVVDSFTGVAGEVLNDTGDGTTQTFTFTPTVTLGNRDVSVSVDGVTLTSGQYTLVDNTATFDITFNTAPANADAIVVTINAQDTFTLSRSNYGETISVDVNGTTVANTTYTLNGLDVVFNAGSVPAGGDTIDVTIPARSTVTLSNTVGPNDLVSITVNGTTSVLGTDWTISGQVVTFATGSIPSTGDAIVITHQGPATTSYTYTSVLLENEDDVAFGTSQGGGAVFGCRYPGDAGNAFKVYILDSGNWNTADAALPWLTDLFDSAPTDSTEMHVVVTELNPDGTETTVETFAFLSKADNGKSADGRNVYYPNVINETSNYIFALNHPAAGTDWGDDLTITKTSFTTLTTYDFGQLGGGTIGSMPTTGNVITGYDLFKDPELVDVSLVLGGEWADLPGGEAVATHIIDSIATTRKDCVAVISPPETIVKSLDAAQVVNYYQNTITTKSNYAFVDSNFKYQYDKYNDKYRWLPFNGDIAGLMARTDAERDAWFSPAGFNRGIIKNVIKVAWNQTKTDRDILYKNSVNPVLTFPGQGTILYGDKTFTAKPSAFDRINVRRLFIVLEKSIAIASKYTLFEFNDEFTRAQFVAMVEPFLRDVKGRRGVYDFLVVCDETNNTPSVVDRNEFVGDIYIKPARSINFIQLNFVAVRSGVSFDEVVGQF